MNKMKKLLSVVLAVVLAFSALSVLGSAAKTAYKTVDELEALAAYSPYGQVTRLSAEERMSIVGDTLDNLLAGLNINMGTVLNVLGLKVTINLTSIDNVCASLDSFADTQSNWLYSIAAGIVNLGIVEEINVKDNWNTGMTRDNTAQLEILNQVLRLLVNNTGAINTVLTDGIELGLIGNFIGGSLDLSGINEMVTNLPKLIKGMLYPMMERWDDTLADVKALDDAINNAGGVEDTLNNFVKNMFAEDRSITTVKYDKNGNMTSEHTKMPIYTAAPGTPADTSPRCYYQITGTTPGSVMTVYHIVDAAEAESLADQVAEGTLKDAEGNLITSAPAAYTYFKETQTYVMAPEVPEWEDTSYVWKATDEWGNTWSMKWYNDNSPYLPSFVEAGETVDLSTSSLADLLYKFIPYVFDEMAPVVLNGSVKKVLAQFFGAKFNYVGQVGDDAVNALADATDAFFSEPQGEYLWEWSNYAVINGNHYYRFEDQIFAADLSNINNYFSMINWDYEITGDFMNEFIPASPSASSTMLMQFNNFLIKVINEVFVTSATFTDLDGFTSNWTLPTLKTGGNENLVANIKAMAQAVIQLAPQHIFGSDYDTNPRCYYNLLISDNNDTILAGIAAQLVDMLMPSMTLPSAEQLADSNAKVGAILAAAIREFAAYLAPEYNYDALIYTDYGTTTADSVKTFVDPVTAGLVSEGQTASGYWLDVCLTIGLDVGYEYLRAFADMGEDSEAWTTGVVGVGYGVDGKTYAAGTTQATLNAQWEGLLDYIVDWALDYDTEWAWKFEKIVDTTGLTIDLATAQDPWTKLDKILNDLLPADEILNVTATDCATELEQLLRYDLILGLVDLRWEDTLALLQIPNGFVRTTNVLDSLATVLKNLINGLFAKIGNANGNFALIPDVITDFDTLASQANLKTMVVNLVGALQTAVITNKLADVGLPFLNMFLGWKTTPQGMAVPSIRTDFRDGNDYVFAYNSSFDGNSIKFTNNSSGMLETHSNGVEDHEYAIQIDSVTHDATVNKNMTITASDSYVSPFEVTSLNFGGTYSGEEAVTVTVKYSFIGKDGKAVGGQQTEMFYVFISNQYEDSNYDGRLNADKEADDKTKAEWYGAFYFTEDIVDFVSNFSPSISLDAGTSDASKSLAGATYPDSGWVYKTIKDGCSTVATITKHATADTSYFRGPGSQTEAQNWGWQTTIDNDNAIASGKIYTTTTNTAEEDMPYGAYDPGAVGIKYGSDTKVFGITFIHYNDYDIGDLYQEHMDLMIMPDDVASGGSSAYTTYQTALKNVVKLAKYPMMTKENSYANGASSATSWNTYTKIDGSTAVTTDAQDYVAGIMPQIPDAMTALENAYEALKPYLDGGDATSSAGADAALPADVKALEDQLALDDGEEELEVNFQDYEFYEYFTYADLRTAHRNFVKTYYAPEIMDTYYIEGSGIREAELNNVIAAEENSIKAAGITASRKTNDPVAVADSVTARNEWTQPVNDPLFVWDMVARLAYYKTFLTGKEENTDHKKFLELEIAHVNAQQLNEEDYETNSWAKFADALAYANEVNAGTAEYANNNSIIYNAKYNLMVAYKNLLLNADSLIQAGGTADLEANAAIAEEIFTSLDAADGTWSVKEGVDADAAYAQLITALGYNYVGQDGYGYNLYADSAYEYIDNDRPNRTSNQAKVNAANNSLVAAIANFETTAVEPQEPNTLVLNENAPFEAIIDTTNCGDYTGTVYGFDPLGNNDDGAIDGTIAEFLSTAYGDEYLEVVVGDSGVETTGAIINVKDAEDNIIETYVYVYFADVDMDGMLTSSDSFFSEYYEMNYDGIPTLEQFMACDVDGDGMVTSSDAFYPEYYEMNYSGMPTQAEIGAMAVNNYYEM